MKNEYSRDIAITDVEPYTAIANAIILQACRDYRRAYKVHLRTYSLGGKPHEKLVELECFFRSDWYKILTSVDGECLMKRIQKEVKAQLKKH